MNKVVVGIISRINGQNEKEWLLVISAKDFGEYTGFYYPPGGHIENDESEQEALIREISEELSLKATPVNKIAESIGDVPNQKTCWWNCRVTGNLRMDPELKDVGYFTLEQIKNDINIWPATRKFFDEHISTN